MANKIRAIAFYLPQFYPTPENDEWWEPGFTEWTNVARAKPLFKGHYQPRIPRDLGFYDLRVPETREKQAQLAREAGIEGFCYWHYWFGNGKRLLADVFREVVESGKPDFPFCLCWANHSWYAKTWDPNVPDKLLMEQTYPGVEDYKAHFYEMLPAFKDKRYIKVNDRLVFGVYAPLDVPDFNLFSATWNKLAVANGLKGFYFFGFTYRSNKINEIISNGYDSVVYDNLMTYYWTKNIITRIKRKFLRIPQLIDYRDYMKEYISCYEASDLIHPCILPNFDHSPRSSHRGNIIINNTPQLWKELCKKIFIKCESRNEENNLIFIKAWNEWGEGNYLEPDNRFGRQYIDKTKEALDEFLMKNV